MVEPSCLTNIVFPKTIIKQIHNNYVVTLLLDSCEVGWFMYNLCNAIPHPKFGSQYQRVLRTKIHAVLHNTCEKAIFSIHRGLFFINST